jgi:hypothetical protein
MVMGIGELAGSAVALVAPYLAEGGKELAKKVGGDVGDRIVKLYDKVKAKLTGVAAKEALADLEAKPEDERRKAALELQLEKALGANPGFRDEVAKLVGEIKAIGGRDVTTQIAHASGQGHKVVQIKGSGNTVG